MNRRFILAVPLFVLLLLQGLEVQGRLIPGTSNSLPRLATSSGTFKLGKKPYPAGTREKWIAEGRVLARAPKGAFPRKSMLKTSADNRQYLPPVGSQGSEGSCVHWAGTYYAKTANMKRKDPSIDVTLKKNQCSPRFTYNLSNAGWDNGNFGHEPFEIFMRYGVPSLAQLPYVAGEYSFLPQMEDFVEGLHRRTADYVWLWEWGPTATEINELKAFLDSGGVAVGALNADHFSSWSAADPPWVGVQGSYYDVNHMVAVCGYGPGYYLLVNSWGKYFGSNGFIYVDADYFEHYVADVFYPVEGTYEPVTHYAEIQIEHPQRSDIQSFSVSVNATVVWSNSLPPRSVPKDEGTWYKRDTRDNWSAAVDLSSGPWSEANSVRAECRDKIYANVGTLTGFSVICQGQSYASPDTPVAIPDANWGAAVATVSIQTASTLAIQPASTNLPAAASAGRLVSIAANVPWTATENLSWVEITGGSPGSGNGTVTFSVTANDGAFRSGTITVSGGGIDRIFTVNQATADVAPKGDFDGDDAADAAVFQPATGNWGLSYSGGGSETVPFGWSAVVPVPADYDGDGQVDLAVYHPATGNWYIRQSIDGQTRAEQFGWSSTIPLPGDYDGDGLADLAVFHQASARWYFRLSTGGADASVAFGWSAVLPVPADYDGDGALDLGVYHPASGNWYFCESSTGETYVQHLGGGKALPVPADYDGDGKADVAVFTRANAQWQIATSGGGSLAKSFGWSAVLPVPADYDGDGAADIAVYHPAGGNWYILSSESGATLVRSCGGPGNHPVLLFSMIHSWFHLL